ncbi:hypothetical protein JCM10213_006618 [Rhodosporidiobolus nylandii]
MSHPSSQVRLAAGKDGTAYEDDITWRPQGLTADEKAHEKAVVLGGQAMWPMLFCSLLCVGLSVWGIVKYHGDDETRFMWAFVITLVGWTVLVGIELFMLQIRGMERVHHEYFVRRTVFIFGGWFFAYLAGSLATIIIWKIKGHFEGSGSYKTGWTLLTVQAVLGALPCMVCFAVYLVYWQRLRGLKLPVRAHEVLSKEEKRARSAESKLRRRMSRTSRGSQRSRLTKRTSLRKEDDYGPVAGGTDSSEDEVAPKYADLDRTARKSPASSLKSPAGSGRARTVATGYGTDSTLTGTDDEYHQTPQPPPPKYDELVRQPYQPQTSPPPASLPSRQQSAGSSYRYSSSAPAPPTYSPPPSSQTHAPYSTAPQKIPVVIRAGNPQHSVLARAQWDPHRNAYSVVNPVMHPPALSYPAHTSPRPPTGQPRQATAYSPPAASSSSPISYPAHPSTPYRSPFASPPPQMSLSRSSTRSERHAPGTASRTSPPARSRRDSVVEIPRTGSADGLRVTNPDDVLPHMPLPPGR